MKICVNAVVPGKQISFYGNPCIVLEHRTDGTLLLSCEQIEHEFGETNNFKDSALMKHLNGAYLDALTQNHRDVVLDREIDLTALNGSKEYGSVTCKVASLTLDELRKYHDIIPKPESFEWSVTPWSTPNVDGDNTWVLGLYSGGVADGDLCSGSYGARPAFLIPSHLLVDVEGEDERCNGLESYSTKELLAEITRRMEAQDE